MNARLAPAGVASFILGLTALAVLPAYHTWTVAAWACLAACLAGFAAGFAIAVIWAVRALGGTR